MINNSEKVIVKKSLDIVICALLVLLSIKKGGFYSGDSFLINIIVILLGLVYIIFCGITRAKDDKSIAERITISEYIKRNIIDILVIIMPLTYLLSIAFNRAINSSETIYEFIRYVNFSMLYYIVKMSNNKKYYLNTIIVIAVIQCIFGIDGLGLRFFKDILKSLNSGYLSTYLDRLSGTIQYANTVAILVGVSGLLVLEKYIKCNNNGYIKAGLFSMIFVLFSTIVLTGTRTVPLLLIPIIVLYSIDNRKDIKKILMTIITQSVLILIYTSVMSQYLIVKSVNIYYVFILFTVISFVVGYLLEKIKLGDTKEQISKFKVNIIIIISVFATLLIYLILAFNISKPLVIEEEMKVDRVKREIYGFNKGQANSIEITLNEKQADSKYTIYLYAEHEKYNKEYITQFNNYQELGNKIYFEYTPKEDFLRLDIEFECNQGKVSIEELKLNERQVKLEYILLPSEYVFRIKNMINGTDSIDSRLTYMKDAVKIISTSPIVGTGGDGFNKMYKEVQSIKYTSSEVHNSFLQIFVEAGIIGGITCVLIVILTIAKSQKSVVKLAYILFICHSIIDINLSYMLMIAVLAILIASANDKNN